MEKERRTCRDRWKHAALRRRLRKRTGLLAVLLLWIIDSAFGREKPRSDFVRNEYECGGRGEPDFRRRLPGRSRYLTRPTLRRLVLDLRRPAARSEALAMLRGRLPVEVLPWLDDAVARQEWTTIATVARSGLPDDLVEVRMMHAALAWLRAQQKDDEGPEDDPTPVTVALRPTGV